MRPIDETAQTSPKHVSHILRKRRTPEFSECPLPGSAVMARIQGYVHRLERDPECQDLSGGEILTRTFARWREHTPAA